MNNPDYIKLIDIKKEALEAEKDYFKAGLRLIDETLEEISGNSSV